MGKETPITYYKVTKYILMGFIRLPFGQKFNYLSQAEKYAENAGVPCIIEDSNGKFVSAYK